MIYTQVVQLEIERQVLNSFGDVNTREKKALDALSSVLVDFTSPTLSDAEPNMRET